MSKFQGVLKMFMLGVLKTISKTVLKYEKNTITLYGTCWNWAADFVFLLRFCTRKRSETYNNNFFPITPDQLESHNFWFWSMSYLKKDIQIKRNNFLFFGAFVWHHSPIPVTMAPLSVSSCARKRKKPSVFCCFCTYSDNNQCGA